MRESRATSGDSPLGATQTPLALPGTHAPPAWVSQPELHPMAVPFRLQWCLQPA